ncbi:MAG TPA: hypothetical protein VNT50_05990, partial [Microbacterium sp.]|nr:hypothetical protein [Microbacterium sp.]
PADHARAVLDRLEGMARDAAVMGTYLVLTAQRLNGSLARVVEPLPSRAVLALATRADHIAAGGEPDGFMPGRPPGRARFGGRELQFARAAAPGSGGGLLVTDDVAPGDWSPDSEFTGVVTRGVRRTVDALATAWNVRVVAVDRLAPGARLGDLLADAGGSPTVLVGDADAWQAQWGLLQALRAQHPLLVDAACATELRTIAGERDLPPYAQPGAGRAWLCTGDSPPRRVVLPLTTA